MSEFNAGVNVPNKSNIKSKNGKWKNQNTGPRDKQHNRVSSELE